MGLPAAGRALPGRPGHPDGPARSGVRVDAVPLRGRGALGCGHDRALIRFGAPGSGSNTAGVGASGSARSEKSSSLAAAPSRLAARPPGRPGPASGGTGWVFRVRSAGAGCTPVRARAPARSAWSGAPPDTPPGPPGPGLVRSPAGRSGPRARVAARSPVRAPGPPGRPGPETRMGAPCRRFRCGPARPRARPGAPPYRRFRCVPAAVPSPSVTPYTPRVPRRTAPVRPGVRLLPPPAPPGENPPEAHLEGPWATGSETLGPAPAKAGERAVSTVPSPGMSHRRRGQ